MSGGSPDRDFAIDVPPRLTRFAPEGSWALRLPSALVGVLQVPFGVSVMFGGLELAVRFFYGYGMFEDGRGWKTLAWVSSPALLVDALYLFGRLELVKAMPNPLRLDAPPPPTLALSGSGERAMRPADPAPKLPAGRRPVDGVLFAFGAGCLGIALALALLQTESFDAVLGIKLGGVHLSGTHYFFGIAFGDSPLDVYWNRWWFVFYGFIGTGLSTLAASLGLFIRRLNARLE